jgi:hypothetical protein
MKFKCKLDIDYHQGNYCLGVYCYHGFLYMIDDYYCLKIISSESDLMEFYKNMNINDIINKIKERLIKQYKKEQYSEEVKNVIKQIKQKGKNIIIEIN